VLTLFDYLRQRAFNAIIDGTQDALEHLENQEAAEGSTKNNGTSPTRPPSIESREAKKDEDNETDAALLPPRRRGRPRKNDKAGQ